MRPRARSTNHPSTSTACAPRVRHPPPPLAAAGVLAACCHRPSVSLPFLTPVCVYTSVHVHVCVCVSIYVISWATFLSLRPSPPTCPSLPPPPPPSLPASQPLVSTLSSLQSAEGGRQGGREGETDEQGGEREREEGGDPSPPHQSETAASRAERKEDREETRWERHGPAARSPLFLNPQPSTPSPKPTGVVKRPYVGVGMPGAPAGRRARGGAGTAFAAGVSACGGRERVRRT